MGISIRFPKFLKNAFSHKEDSTTSTRTVSITSASYTRDPMRCGNHPDVVGYYYDPMGGKYSSHKGYDCTNTGA
ncbi:hypothetical protein MFLAVUS_010945 [Mucor flavus]|uniref:NBS-LRR type resistance protein n=1 Tax=Mucor flavus TaxID=439312 RepID=A0ABP9ZE51_9FUNG